MKYIPKRNFYLCVLIDPGPFIMPFTYILTKIAEYQSFYVMEYLYVVLFVCSVFFLRLKYIIIHLAIK